MQENISNKIDEKLLDKIVAVAYGDAGLYDRLIVWMNARRDPEIEKLLAEYRLTTKSVHQLIETELPESTLNYVRQRTIAKPKNDFFSSIIYSFASKPLLSASTAGIIIVVIVSVLFFYNPPPEHNYTKAEIELAQQQLGESLAIVNKVFQNTEKKIDMEVLSKHVSKPLNKGLIYLNDYLIGG
jgi:hypothetical protein